MGQCVVRQPLDLAFSPAHKAQVLSALLGHDPCHAMHPTAVVQGSLSFLHTAPAILPATHQPFIPGPHLHGLLPHLTSSTHSQDHTLS